jgi:hypothetical protein
MKLVPVSESPINRNTAYKYHCLKKYPALVFKVAGKLFVDLDEWDNMAEVARDKHVKESKRAMA